MHMEFERQLMAASDFTLDQVRFFVALSASLLAGFLIRFIPGSKARNLFSAVVGFMLLYYPLGNQVSHGIFTSMVTYVVMWRMPRKCGTLTWLLIFPYLIFMHVANASGLFWEAGDMDFTGPQMVLTLKLVSMAVSYQDAHSKQKEGLTNYQAAHVFCKLPSLLEYFGFVFAFGNLLGGSVIEFQDYRMWVNRQGPWAQTTDRKVPWTGDMMAAFGAFCTAVLSLVVYLSLEPGWNLDLLATPWYHTQPLLVRLATMQVIGLVYRCSFYLAWSIGHCSLALAGMDFLRWEQEPKDSRKVKGVWGRCKNAQVLKVELCDSSRRLGRDWNTTTGNFLRRYVYERLTTPGQKPTFWTLMATELVSAVWHGLYPGYIFFFAGLAVFFAYSTVIYQFEKAYLPSWFTGSWPWWAFKVVLTKQGMDFLEIAFLLLTWRECIAAWSSVHYLPLIGMILVLVLGEIFLDKRPSRSGSRQGVAAAAAEPDGSFEQEQQAAGGNNGEPMGGDRQHLGEGFKSVLVTSRLGSRPDLITGIKSE